MSSQLQVQLVRRGFHWHLASVKVVCFITWFVNNLIRWNYLLIFCMEWVNIPVLVEASLAFITEMLSPNHLKWSHPSWSLNVSNYTNNHNRRCLHNGHSLNNFLLVHFYQQNVLKTINIYPLSNQYYTIGIRWMKFTQVRHLFTVKPFPTPPNNKCLHWSFKQ